MCGRQSRLAPSRTTMRTGLVDAEPDPIAIDPEATALVIIDMQRDFLEPGGFGETLGNDVSLLNKAVAPCRSLLEVARRLGMLVVHTREGHRPDLSDAPRAKVERGVADVADRFAGSDGTHPDPRRAGPRHYSGARAHRRRTDR